MERRKLCWGINQTGSLCIDKDAMVILDGRSIVGAILALSQTKQGKKQGRRRWPRPEIAGKVKACTYSTPVPATRHICSRLRLELSAGVHASLTAS